MNMSLTLPPFIKPMLEPDFYPHPVTTPIQFIQTHVSIVFLTGDYAYKVKKPVDFGFLDYSTLEKRHHFCQEELRLNQRGAADLYLEVIPITISDDRYGLGLPGEIIDYTLKMRQFPQHSLFSELFNQGLLTVERLEELGRVTAQFHGQGVTNDYIRSFGEISQIKEAFDENYEQTRGYIGGPQTQQQFEETQAYSDRFFTEHTDLFASRRQGDWIRECHGDMHLGNICLWQDKITLFDCIEFNEPFRFVDVMFDVAYIVMDCDARNRSDLAYGFLNSYVEQTGDWDGLRVLPIYVSRQSYVRAKVTSFLLNDPAISPADRKEAETTAALYYQLAWQYTQPRAGRLLLMSGLSGSGKSTIARKLALELGAIHIRSDAVRKHLAGVPLLERGGAELYTPAMTSQTYDRLLNLGVTLAKDGYTVILDAKYDRQLLREEAIAQANHQGLPLTILHCSAPLAVLQQRLEERTGDIADATAQLLPTQVAVFEEFTQKELSSMITIDTSADIDVHHLKSVIQP